MLVGLSFEDQSLCNLASLPFAREFRVLGGGWHSIDIAQSMQDTELAVQNAERMLVRTARQRSTPRNLDIIRCQKIEGIASVSHTSDIVMLFEHSNPAERVTQQSLWLRDAAFRSPAAVMLVPDPVVRTTGLVVALAATPDDVSIQVAGSIAAAAKEDLVIFEAYAGAGSGTASRQLAPASSTMVRRFRVGSAALSDSSILIHGLAGLQEGLVVLTRGTCDVRIASKLASPEHVPVLIVEREGWPGRRTE